MGQQRQSVPTQSTHRGRNGLDMKQQEAQALSKAASIFDDYTVQEWMKAYHRACAKNPDVQPKFCWIVRELKREQ